MQFASAVNFRHQLIDGRYSYPLDVALTEYNVLLLYSNHIEAVSLLNQKLMFDDTIGTVSWMVLVKMNSNLISNLCALQ